MAKWDYTVKLGRRFNDDTTTYEERRDYTVKVFRDLADTLPEYEELDWLLEELATAADTDSFDETWGEVYDWADANRVWIDTFSD